MSEIYNIVGIRIRKSLKSHLHTQRKLNRSKMWGGDVLIVNVHFTVYSICLLLCYMTDWDSVSFVRLC